MEADPEVIQARAREEMLLTQEEIDQVNGRILRHLKNKVYIIEMMRAVYYYDNDTCEPIDNLKAFKQHMESVERGQQEVTTTEEFSYILSRDSDLHVFGIGLLAHLQKYDFRWIVLKQLVKIQPRPQMVHRRARNALDHFVDSLLGAQFVYPPLRSGAMYTLSLDIGSSTLSKNESKKAVDRYTAETRKLLQDASIFSPREVPATVVTTPRIAVGAPSPRAAAAAVKSVENQPSDSASSSDIEDFSVSSDESDEEAAPPLEQTRGSLQGRSVSMGSPKSAPQLPSLPEVTVDDATLPPPVQKTHGRRVSESASFIRINANKKK